MKVHSLYLLAVIIQSCSAGLWGSSKSDPVKAEKELSAAPASKYDYKLSFKKPYAFNGTIPFWNTGGDVLKAEDFIRLSPSVPNTSGYIWSTLPNSHEEWEIEIAFKVSGTHVNGGRGLAFWYTKENMQTGPVFGSKDKWDGLSVWLDSANPKTHKATAMVILNDGTHAFTAGADPTKLALNTCSVGYRNAYNPSHLKVSYKDNTLTVSVNDGVDIKDYRTCSQKSGIQLPTGYYFGVSASSHNPGDDHDVISFETRQLNPPQKIEHLNRPLEEAKKKKGEEFKGIADEQKKKIEEVESEMRKLKESSNESNEMNTNMAAIYDVQRRSVETLSLLQLQIEALGAPTPQEIIERRMKGENIVMRSDEKLQTVLSQSKEETEKNRIQFNRIMDDQNQKIENMLTIVHRLEEALATIDKRILTQSNMMQSKMNEVNIHSAEAKGTMSNFIKFIFYALIAQFLFGVAIYLYWKLRVERNDKKFV